MRVIIALYCIRLLNLTHYCLNSVSGAWWTRQIWHSATQLSVISICDAPLKVSYLITTAVEALSRGDVEQKIHLKSTLEGINLDVILNITSQDRASRKLHTGQYLKALNF